MEKKIPSWKTLFQITEVLELAALRKDARSHNRLYGSLTFSQSRVCVALIRLLEKRPSGVSLKELAAELKKEYTIIMVTHNMQQAARISDKTAFFLLGNMIEYGETEQIFSMPKDKRTEDYITGRFG